jgi:hypothetical protein
MESSWNIYRHYVNTMTDYLLHYTSSEKFKKKDNDYIYLLQHGFSTLTHIFKITLREKLDINEAIENTKKGIVYYTEFIEQMEENSIHDINISSVNAAVFVLKKTIAHITTNDLQNKNASTVDDTTVKKIKNFEHLLIIHRDIFEILTMYGYNSMIPDKLMEFAFDIYIDAIKNDNNNDNNTEIINKDEERLTEQLSNIIIFINHFTEGDKELHQSENYIYDYIQLYVKYYKHIPITIEQIYQKKIRPDYYLRLHNNPIKKYIKWLIS